jgi:hypothetical protein
LHFNHSTPQRRNGTKAPQLSLITSSAIIFSMINTVVFSMIDTIVGGLIGFLASLGTWYITRRIEKRDQRKVAFGWLRLEVEWNLKRLNDYKEKESEWRNPPQILEINFPPFPRLAYQALIQHGPIFISQDRELLKLIESFYDRLLMVEYLRRRFNKREPAGKQESLDNLMKAIEAARKDGEELLKTFDEKGIQG